MNWKQLLESISEAPNDHMRLRNAYLMAENRILGNQINDQVQITDSERRELAEIGAKLGKKTLAEIWTYLVTERSCERQAGKTVLEQTQSTFEIDAVRQSRSQAKGEMISLSAARPRPTRDGRVQRRQRCERSIQG